MIAKFTVLLALTAAASAQGSTDSSTYFSFVGTGPNGAGFQLYLDFAPAVVGVLPPPVADPGDLLVVVGPFAGGASPSTFAQGMIASINDGFAKNVFPPTYFATTPRKARPDDLAHNATVMLVSPVPLARSWVSGGSGQPPSTEVTTSAGSAHNPTIYNLDDFVQSADPGGPNAQILVDGLDPTLDPVHTIEVELPSSPTLTIASGGNSNVPFLLLIGDSYTPGRLQTVFGGSVDVFIPGGYAGLGVFVALDGICGDPNLYHTTGGSFSLSLAAPVLLTGMRVVAQAVLVDPTAAPLNVDLSAAADLQFAAGQTQTIALPNDGATTVALVGGGVFPFYGATYSTVGVHDNGFLTFGSTTSLPGGGFAIDPIAALGAEPAVFVNWADWATATSADAIRVTEFGARLRVHWGTSANPIDHTLAPAPGKRRDGLQPPALGNFSATLHLDPLGQVVPARQQLRTTPGSIFIDNGDFTMTGASASRYDAVVGISPGLGLAPGPVPSLDLGESQVAAGPLHALLSQDNRSAAAASALLANGAAQRFHDGQSWSMRGVYFSPPDLLSPGYVSHATRSKPNRLTEVGTNRLSASLLPAVLRLIGQFKYFFGQGPSAITPSVDLVVTGPAGGAPVVVPLGIIGVMAPAGSIAGPTVPIEPGYRDYEGLVLNVPAHTALQPGATATVVATFADGSVHQILSALMIIP